MTRSVFDALIAVICNVTEPSTHIKLRTSVNQITRRIFDTRTLFNHTPKGLTILHTLSYDGRWQHNPQKTTNPTSPQRLWLPARRDELLHFLH